MTTPADRLYAGTIGDFDDSMAQEIEIALNALMGPLPSAPQKFVDDRRRLFIAIANGVITHMQKHQASFEISFNPGTGAITINPNIKVRT